MTTPTHRIAILSVICLSVFSAPVSGEMKTKADFYVAPSGNNSNTGTPAKPLATIERARDAVRKKIAKGMKRDVVVVLRGGNYFVDGAIRFGFSSGDKGHGSRHKGHKGKQRTAKGCNGHDNGGDSDSKINKGLKGKQRRATVC